jgi:hypothetical protein
MVGADAASPHRATGAPAPPPAMRKLTPAEAKLLSQLADNKLLSSEIDPEAIKVLERDGFVRRMLGAWHVTPSGALAVMSHAA